MSPATQGMREVSGLSVINLNDRPRIYTIKLVTRKVFASIRFIFHIKEMSVRAPMTETREMRANTADKNEKRYHEASDARMMLPTMRYRVCLIVEVENIPRVVVNNTPRAKALESMVPMNAAINETANNELSHEGSAESTSVTKRFDGSEITPENLKLMPRYAIDPATNTRSPNAP